MRFSRTLALLATAVLLYLVGPVVLLGVLVAFAVPRARRRLWPWLRPTRRVVAGWTAGVLALVGLVVLVPDGWLPVPSGGGVAVTPRYDGRPARARPIELPVPEHPAMAPNGRSAMHGDAWATDTHPGPGPLGDTPEVDTAWYGLEECATLAFDVRGRLVALCGDLEGPTLRVLDPESMRPLATKDLPDRRDSDVRPWEDLCGGSYFYLDERDRAVVATTDRRVLVVGTADGAGEPDLTTEVTHDLTGVVPEDDCLVALLPDWSGRIWWVTKGGRVGTIAADGAVRVLDLDEEVANSLAADEDGSVYLVTVEALYRLVADRDGQPRVRWRTTYDRGTERKTGQLSRGSGTTPTILPGGLVAITDNADRRMHVVFHTTASGHEVCRAEVFGEDAGATDNSLVAVGDGGVVVENNHGYGGPWSTLLGRTTSPGLARVDVADGECDVVWTSPETAPTSVAKASLATGLVYAYTKRRSWWGVDAWYLTALDARTGRTAFSVRTGLGPLLNNHYSAVTLGPDGSAYVPVLAGMVRVRDKG